MDPKEWQSLAAKYLSGQCSESEWQLFQEWQKNAPVEEDHVQSLSDKEHEGLEVRMRQNIDQAINLVENKEKDYQTLSAPVRQRRIYHFKSFLTRYAALFVLGLGLSLLYYAHKADIFNTTSETTFRQFVNLTDKTIQYVLPDGSTVWLNAQTTLRFPEKFSDDRREVFLNGEVFFDVKKNANWPFIIRSGSVVTRVLGTSFNVKAYEGDELVEVAVVTGKVAVQKIGHQEEITASQQEDSGVILIPSEKATYSNKTLHLVKTTLRSANDPVVWKEDRLLFNDVTVGEVFKTLSRKYGIVIQTSSDNIRKCKVKIDLTGQSLDKMLSIICQLINADYQINENQVTVSGEGCSN